MPRTRKTKKTIQPKEEALDNNDGYLTDNENYMEPLPVKPTKTKKQKKRRTKRQLNSIKSSKGQPNENRIKNLANRLQEISSESIMNKPLTSNLESNARDEVKRGLSLHSKLKKLQSSKTKRQSIKPLTKPIPFNYTNDTMRQVNSNDDLSRIVIKPKKTKRKLVLPKVLIKRIRTLNNGSRNNNMVMGKCPKCGNIHMIPRSVKELTNTHNLNSSINYENNNEFDSGYDTDYEQNTPENYEKQLTATVKVSSVNGKTQKSAQLISNNSRDDFIKVTEIINGRKVTRLIPRN